MGSVRDGGVTVVRRADNKHREEGKGRMDIGRLDHPQPWWEE